MTTLSRPVARSVKVRGYSNRSLVISIEPLDGGDAIIRVREKGSRGVGVHISAMALYARLVAGGK